MASVSSQRCPKMTGQFPICGCQTLISLAATLSHPREIVDLLLWLAHTLVSGRGLMQVSKVAQPQASIAVILLHRRARFLGISRPGYAPVTTRWPLFVPISSLPALLRPQSIPSRRDGLLRSSDRLRNLPVFWGPRVVSVSRKLFI